MAAGAIRVVVNGSGRNDQIADRRRSLQKQSRRVALFGVVVALVGLTFQIISIVKDDNDSTWWIVLIVLLVAIVAMLGRQRSIATTISNRSRIDPTGLS
jgi:uncharacterized membrane protein